MIHFIWGMLFLISTMMLTAAYIITTMWLGHRFRYGAKRWWKLFNSKEGESTEELEAEIKAGRKAFFTRKFAYTLAGFLLVFHLSLYAAQRSKWMGEDNANLAAKEYYVAGQVLNAVRGILTIFIHPEFPVMAPLNALQEEIFKKGVPYLPDGDGEIAVWQHQWFGYHYTKKLRNAMFDVSWEPSPKTVKLLDQWWFCLETMATRPFLDRQMMEEHYYRDFPGLAMGYSVFEGFYSGKKSGSFELMLQMPEHVLRSRQLAGWLWALREKWKASESMEVFLEKNPKLLVIWQFEFLFKLDDVLSGEIHARTFDCDGLWVQRYRMVRKEFANPDQGLPAYARMKDRAQAERLYRMTINAVHAKDIRYLLKYYCGIPLAGKVDFSYYEQRAKFYGTTMEEEGESFGKPFDELIILEEMGYDRRDGGFGKN